PPRGATLFPTRRPSDLPIITFAADGTGWTFFMGSGNTPYQFGDFRFMDFEIQGRGFNYSGFHAEGAFNNLTILRVDASEMGVFRSEEHMSELQSRENLV